MADRCYVLILPNGEEVGDGPTHYGTEKDAMAAVELAIEEGAEAPPTLRMLDAECVMVSCSACSYTYDEDDTWRVHFETRDEALPFLSDQGWTFSGDEALCPECAETAEAVTSGE